MSQDAVVASCLQEVLGPLADQLSQQHGLTQRRGKLSGGKFARTLVLGFLAHPAASLQDLAQTAALVGEPVSPQAIDQRFTAAAGQHLRALLEAAMRKVVRADEPAAVELLDRFSEVCVQDSTTLVLPDVFEEQFRGCGGTTDRDGRSALKFQVRYELRRGGLQGFEIQQGRDSDCRTVLQRSELVAGSLHLRDLGYFDVEVLAEIARQAAFFLSRLHDQTGVWDAHGQRVQVAQRLASCPAKVIECPVFLGAGQRLPCRLIAVRLPSALAERRRRELHRRAQKKGYTPSQDKLTLCAWNVYVTNVPADRLSAEEAVALIRMRWQIELLFKQWKSDGGLAQSRSDNPQRILAEIFAKMLALLLQHWMLLAACWRYPDRSLRRAAKAVRRLAAALATTLHDQAGLTQCIQVRCP